MLEAPCEVQPHNRLDRNIKLKGVRQPRLATRLPWAMGGGAWKDFIRDMVKRGLNTPVLITTDGAPGLIRAVDETWSKSLRQRCLTHKVQNVVDKVPENVRAEVKAAINSSYRAPNREIAEMITTDVLERYQELYPSAMKSFSEDLEACWAHLRYPSIHHKRIRTTNLLERAFGEQKRRTKVIPRFMTEQSCLKLVFATLWQVSQRWHGVRMSEFEQQQLKRLRHELGLASQDASDASLQQVARLTLLFLQQIQDLTH